MTNLHNVSVSGMPSWQEALKTLTLLTLSLSLLLKVKAHHILTSFYGCTPFRKSTMYFISNETDPYINNQIYIKAILGFLPYEVMP